MLMADAGTTETNAVQLPAHEQLRSIGRETAPSAAGLAAAIWQRLWSGCSDCLPLLLAGVTPTGVTPASSPNCRRCSVPVLLAS